MTILSVYEGAVDVTSSATWLSLTGSNRAYTLTFNNYNVAIDLGAQKLYSITLRVNDGIANND